MHINLRHYTSKLNINKIKKSFDNEEEINFCLSVIWDILLHKLISIVKSDKLISLFTHEYAYIFLNIGEIIFVSLKMKYAHDI